MNPRSTDCEADALNGRYKYVTKKFRQKLNVQTTTDNLFYLQTLSTLFEFVQL